MSEQKPPTELVVLPEAEVEAGALVPQNPVTAAIARMNVWQMTLVVVMIVFTWLWFDIHSQVGNMQHELARRLAEMDGTNKANQVLAMQGQESVRELSAKLALLEARFAETQNQRAALESLYQELSSSRDETTLAEVEQMLLIAGQQLQLSANVKAALIAMQQADDYLKGMDRASLSGLRKTLGGDMDKLRTLPVVNISDLNGRVDNLIAMVDVIPLAQEVSPSSESSVKAVPSKVQESTWQRLLHEIWDDAKQLVRIENTQKPEFPLLSPTQTFFLRENLKLRLLSARLSLLSHDETGFKRNLQSAQEWVARYFDARSTQGALAVSVLQKLRSTSVNLDLPDISASLTAVRAYRASHEKPVR